MFLTDAPRNTLASVHPSAEPVEGDSVTLTCSSDANPPAQNYTWYKKRGDQSSQVGSSQNISMANISSEQSGLYYCEAGNEIGQNRSPVVQISVTCKFWTQDMQQKLSSYLPTSVMISVQVSYYSYYINSNLDYNVFARWKSYFIILSFSCEIQITVCQVSHTLLLQWRKRNPCWFLRCNQCWFFCCWWDIVGTDIWFTVNVS